MLHAWGDVPVFTCGVSQFSVFSIATHLGSPPPHCRFCASEGAPNPDRVPLMQEFRHVAHALALTSPGTQDPLSLHAEVARERVHRIRAPGTLPSQCLTPARASRSLARDHTRTTDKAHRKVTKFLNHHTQINNDIATCYCGGYALPWLG